MKQIDSKDFKVMKAGKRIDVEILDINFRDKQVWYKDKEDRIH